jgi:steroid Delta-isomerase
MSRLDTLRDYAAVFSDFSPDALARLDTLCRPDVTFRDPFHGVTGLAQMRAIFEAMFELFQAPRFTVRDFALGTDHGFILWTFDGGPEDGATIRFDGTSTLTFDRDGWIVAHVDHWDAAAAIHERVPLLGTAIRLVNRRIAAKVQRSQR